MESVNQSRRDFLQLVGKGSAMVALLSVVPFQFSFAKSELTGHEDLLKFDKTGWGACTVNCGSLCGLKLFIKDNKIAWAETDNEGKDEFGSHQVRACLRGRSARWKVFNENRIKYPMKRIGKRGEGKFQRISWDEAFSMMADKIKDIKGKYGNEAFYISYGTGSLKGTMSKSWPQGSSPFARLMNNYGGYLNHYNDYSAAQIEDGLDAFYGGWGAGSDLGSIKDSDAVFMFGNNTVVTRMSGGGANFALMETLKNKKIPVVVIDPRLSDTAARLSTKWVAIRPGTDAALIAGMIYVILDKKLQNQAFLDKYCVGFDSATLPKDAPKNGSYRDYIMGTGDDKTPKTPEWASKITGIPAAQITELAMLLGKSKTPFIVQGWGPQRHSNGTQISRAIATLACVKGFGVPGTNSGAREGGSASVALARFPVGTNPVKTTISMFTWTDAIYRHNEMTDKTAGVRGAEKLSAPIKFIWNYAGNMMNQHADFTKTAEILSDDTKCEFIVEVNVTLTPSGKYADLLLPDTTAFEQLDMSNNGDMGNRPYVIMSTKAIDPLYEAKTVYEMGLGIAKKLGIEKEYSEGRSHEDWMKFLWEESRKKSPKLPTYEQMLKQGIFKGDKTEFNVAYKAFVADPVANKLSTPTGKIEIYSTTMAEKAKTWTMEKGNEMHALPVHWNSRESYFDDARKKFPLQCFGYHYKGRTHSSFWEIEAIREINPQYAWMNPVDAEARGVKHGDTIQIFNDRGTVQIIVGITTRVRPGVVTFPQGAWRKLDEKGVDIGACINTLSSLMPTELAKGNGTHSILVDVKKV